MNNATDAPRCSENDRPVFRLSNLHCTRQRFVLGQPLRRVFIVCTAWRLRASTRNGAFIGCKNICRLEFRWLYQVTSSRRNRNSIELLSFCKFLSLFFSLQSEVSNKFSFPFFFNYIHFFSSRAKNRFFFLSDSQSNF